MRIGLSVLSTHLSMSCVLPLANHSGCCSKQFRSACLIVMLSFAKRSSCICARKKLLIYRVMPHSPTGGLLTCKIVLRVFDGIALVTVGTNIRHMDTNVGIHR